MANTDYFPCFHSYRKRLAKLSDQEVGRLFRALMEYSETGLTQELAGRESVAFDFIAADIDRAKEAYAKKCETNRRNRQQLSTTDDDRELPSTTGDKRKRERKRKINPPLTEGERACAREAPTPAVEAVWADFLGRVDPSAPPQCLEELSVYAQEMGEAVCKRAIDIALERRKAAWPYIRAILQDKRERGVKSLADWEALDGCRHGNAPRQDVQPDAERIRQNNEWLDNFLAGQKEA